MYDWMLSTGIPKAFARSASNDPQGITGYVSVTQFDHTQNQLQRLTQISNRAYCQLAI